jgi:hypothetical protein
VKIQTRFLPVWAPTELAVRIYPDVIFGDTHEEALTRAEFEAAKAYWTDGWTPASEADAWRALLRRRSCSSSRARAAPPQAERRRGCGPQVEAGIVDVHRAHSTVGNRFLPQAADERPEVVRRARRELHE